MNPFLSTLRRWLLVLVLLQAIAVRGWTNGSNRDDDLTWTVLQPEHDLRDPSERNYDDVTSRRMVLSMAAFEPVFHHRITWRKIRIIDLLTTPAPFCELDFDALHPLVFTPAEKAAMTEYLNRGGFVLVAQDAYPYTPAQYWPIKGYPVTDFLLKELPALDPTYTSERITEAHPLFRQVHQATINEAEKNELRDNPNSPDFTLVYHRGHPCAFIYGNYVCDSNSWVQLTKPFIPDYPTIPEDYALNVNLYVYVQMH